jgi:branched-chain amino acid transport system substrate-binding protein
MTRWMALLCLAVVGWPPRTARAAEPVLIGLDAEFGYASSTSAEAIRNGMRIAIEEINASGGVLGGRPLAIVERANHSVPSRSIANVEELAAMPGLVAVFCGRFSPTVVEALPAVQRHRVILLDPWAAADAIVDNGQSPNFAFRLSVRDSWAVRLLLREVTRRGLERVGLLLLNTSWGRSSQRAAEEWQAARGTPRVVGTRWIQWNDSSFLEAYRGLRRRGAQAILLVANANEAAVLIREVAALPPPERLPIFSHWGITGGDLPGLAGPALAQVDLSVVQTFSFLDARSPAAARVVAAHDRLFGSSGPRRIQAPVGVAHAYDLTHLLARAIDRAGSTDRPAVRDALERLGPHLGLVKRYPAPFTPGRHEALAPEDAFIARYAPDGALVRVPAGRRGPDGR